MHIHMVLSLKYASMFGLGAIFALNGFTQTKVENKYSFIPSFQYSKPESSPIFTPEYIFRLNSKTLFATNNLRIEKYREWPITIEQSVPTFQTRGELGRYAGKRIADGLGIALYTHKELGNLNLGRDSKLKASVGLRNIEPRVELTMVDIASTFFNFEAESRIGVPLELKLYKNIRGGQLGLYMDYAPNHKDKEGIKAYTGFIKRF